LAYAKISPVSIGVMPKIAKAAKDVVSAVRFPLKDMGKAWMAGSVTPAKAGAGHDGS
jgi:hypothetical protein